MPKSTEDLLYGIQRTLNELLSLFILANQGKLEKEKERLLPKGSIKETIYNLCDGTRSTSDVAETIGKGSGYVGSYLSILRREGLIRSVRRDGKTVHEQIF